MLLRRSLFVLDIFVLLAVVLFLVFLPAERCAHFEARETPIDSHCNIHPAHHAQFRIAAEQDSVKHKHHVSVCHRLHWEHYKFWDDMYLILLPCFLCVALVAYTICEICEFDLFVGQVCYFNDTSPSTVRSVFRTSLVTLSIFIVLYAIGIILREQNQTATNWPFLKHAQLWGASEASVSVTVPATWQYSIAMCILSALFKIGRLLIQHFFGDKKFALDDDVIPREKKPSRELASNLAAPSMLLNESRYSRIEAD